MGIKTNKELSFGRLIDEGKSKEEICKLKNLTSEAYDKSYASLMKIREARRRVEESEAFQKELREHNCKQKPPGEEIIVDGGFWRARNVGSGFIDKIRYCPWCGAKLREMNERREEKQKVSG